MSGIQQMLLGTKPQLSVLVHNTGEGGGEGAYSTDGAEDRTITFLNTGAFQANSGPGTQAYNWLLAGLAADAEIMFHQVSGTAVVGSTLDVFLNLGTTRGITLVWPGGAGSSNAAIEISIREASTGTVKVASVPITLNTHP